MIFLVDARGIISALMVTDYIKLSNEQVRETFVFFSPGPAMKCSQNILREKASKS